MLEILTQIFDISSKIRPYNVLDFDPNFGLIMYEILSLINILTKIRNILNKMFEILTNIFKIFVKILDILPKMVEIFDQNVGDVLRNV